jgi:hypothetical protein
MPVLPLNTLTRSSHSEAPSHRNSCWVNPAGMLTALMRSTNTWLPSVTDSAGSVPLRTSVTGVLSLRTIATVTPGGTGLAWFCCSCPA